MLDRPSPTTKTWTPERDATLTKLWMDGKSGSEIADYFGDGVTRNAVIGRVHRLKLKGRGGAAPRQRRSRAEILADAKSHQPIGETAKQNGNRGVAKANAIVHRVLTAPKPRVLPIPKGLPEIGKRRRLIDLSLPITECRYCDGDPLTADHSFCGQPVKEGSSWCEYHHRRVFPARAQIGA